METYNELVKKGLFDTRFFSDIDLKQRRLTRGQQRYSTNDIDAYEYEVPLREFFNIYRKDVRRLPVYIILRACDIPLACNYILSLPEEKKADKKEIRSRAMEKLKGGYDIALRYIMSASIKKRTEIVKAWKDAWEGIPSFESNQKIIVKEQKKRTPAAFNRIGFDPDGKNSLKECLRLLDEKELIVLPEHFDFDLYFGSGRITYSEKQRRSKIDIQYEGMYGVIAFLEYLDAGYDCKLLKPRRKLALIQGIFTYNKKEINIRSLSQMHGDQIYREKIEKAYSYISRLNNNPS